MRARWCLVTAVVLVLAACTVEPAAKDRRDGPKAWGEALLLGTKDGPVAVSAATGSPLLSGIDGIASSDGSRLYTTSRSDGGTLLETLDAATGDVIDAATVRGRFDVAVVAASGRAAALVEPLPPGIEPWTPIPRSRTTIVVADPTGGSPERRHVLDGNYEPEAFSTDDSRLFLIQHLPAERPQVYRVTVLDLASGKVGEVLGPFKSPPERMPGTRLEQVPSPDGRFLFTLYTTERPDYAHLGIESDRPARVLSFVHVLSLEDGWAHCAGLPKALWGRPAEAQAMAVSPDGRSLYVLDAGLGTVTVMDTESLFVSRPRTILEPTPGRTHAAAAVTADGGTLLVGSGTSVAIVDTSTLSLLDTWEAGGEVAGLALSRTGDRVFVVLDDRIAVLDPATNDEVGGAPLPALGSIVSVATIGV